MRSSLWSLVTRSTSSGRRPIGSSFELKGSRDKRAGRAHGRDLVAHGGHQLAARNPPIDQAVLEGLARIQNIVAVDIALDALHRLAGGVGQNPVQRVTHTED